MSGSEVAIAGVIAPQIYAVRHAVLRIGQPEESCQFPGDLDSSTQHFAYFYQKRMVAIASLFVESNASFKALKQWRLRGMATLPEFQRRGFGGALLDCCQTHICRGGGGRLWCNAREGALSFYQRAGFSHQGKPFELPEIGVHWLMSQLIAGQ